MIRKEEFLYVERRKHFGYADRRPSVQLLRGFIDLDDEFDYAINWDRKCFVQPEFTEEELDELKTCTNTQKNLYYALKIATMNGCVGVRVNRDTLMEASRFKTVHAYSKALNNLESKELLAIKRVKYPIAQRSAPRSIFFIDKYRTEITEPVIERHPDVWILKGEDDV